MKNKAFSVAGLFLITLIWGYAFIVVKEALDVLPTTYMLAARFSVAFVALSVIYFYKFKQITKTVLKQGFVLGLLLYLFYYFQTYGCLYTTAGKNAFLTTIYVVAVPFLNWFIVKSRPTKYNVIAGFTALFGIGLLSLNGEHGINIGDVLTVIAGVGVAVHMIYIAKYAEKSDAILLSVLQLGVASAVGWAVVLVSGESFTVAQVTPGVLYAVLYLGLLSTMVANVLQNVCQKYVSPSVTSLILSAESVVAMLFSVTMLNEQLTPKMLIGCVLIFGSILISEFRHYTE